MTSDIKKFLENLDERFNIIKSQADKYFDNESEIRNDGTVQIFNRPWIAPLNFGMLLFPPVEKKWLNIFKEKSGIEIPDFYQSILLKMNGFRIFHCALFGLPKSIYENGLLDRTMLQPLSLESANILWKVNFKVNDDFFYIGSRRFDDDENSGYFLYQNEIFSIRENGEILNSWITFEDFLNEELNIAEDYMLQTESNK